jgi:hypothetical protein
MRRGQYVRVTAYLVPFPLPFTSTTDLETVALLSSTLWLMEGWLRNNLLIGSKIYLSARIREGRSCVGEFESENIERIEGQYALTRVELYQFVLVPPFRKETFAEFA